MFLENQRASYQSLETLEAVKHQPIYGGRIPNRHKWRYVSVQAKYADGLVIAETLLQREVSQFWLWRHGRTARWSKLPVTDTEFHGFLQGRLVPVSCWSLTKQL